MEVIESFRMAFKTLKAHKLRTFLTTLGVIIGVGAVLANVGALEGFDAFFEEEIQALGANFVSIQAGEDPDEIAQGDQYFDEYLLDILEDVPRSDATAMNQEAGSVTYGDQTERSMIIGVAPGYFDVADQDVVTGSTLDRQDDRKVVVSESYAYTEFDDPIIVGSTIELSFGLEFIGEPVKEEFTVKGIVEDMGEFGEFIPGVFIPVDTLNEVIDGEGYEMIELFAETEDDIDQVVEDTIEILDRELRSEPDLVMEREEHEEIEEPVDDEDMMAAWGMEDVEEDFMIQGDGYAIITQDAVLDFADDMAESINIVMIGVASISLLVGGIGIANIMLVTVSERTREIGVMKAVGATNQDVLGLFLIESGVIGLIGGFIGLILGVLFSVAVVPAFLGVEGIIPVDWVGISIGISFLVGIGSGLYPAFRAANMDPVEALSYE